MNSRREPSPCSSPTSRDPRPAPAIGRALCQRTDRMSYTPAHSIPSVERPEVDTQGDAFFVAFARATDAVSAAVAAQHALPHILARRCGGACAHGVAYGRAKLSSEGYVGLDVHHAARIMSAGHGGQVLLSQTTRDLVEHDLPERREPTGFGSASPQGLTASQPPLSARHCGPAC